MPGITNEHKLTPLFEGALSEELGAASGFGQANALASSITLASPNAQGRRLDAVRRTLDGIGGLGWSVIGFVVGAVFWHFVGFWGFVANVVLAGGGIASSASSAHPAHVERRANWVQVAEASTTAPAACTMLFLDRQTGLTSAHACESDHPPLPADSFEGREDRMVTSGGEPAARGDREQPSTP
ncbi:hypothetical protein [Hyphomicrobium sp. LHD-15]|uniref:hypothetical protein n=1 Tax=Hyphomicrobium sp. LHD-15 TaxID=3072142 RepID=UPI00280C4BD1|nr:hypothetical protein [Hyphomicrobium sp. LHD-15]MDQ8699441.1 hypothetical protein [Hyphomicrobium sp. LHD-15]